MMKIAEILECPKDEIEADTHFATLGLDSLSMLTLTGDLASWLGCDLGAPLLLGYPTINSLAQHLAWREDTEELTQIPVATRGRPFPLTFQQRRIWSYSKTGPEGDGNVICRRYFIRGHLKVDVLQDTFRGLLKRHEILRTTFAIQDGEGVQIIHALRDFQIEMKDLTSLANGEQGAEQILSEASNNPMDLQQGPLFRVLLLKLAPLEHRLIIVVHHLLFDAEALTILHEDVEVLYGAFSRGELSPLSEPPLQVADVAAWQHEWLRKDGDAYQSRMTWWKQHWQGAMPAPLRLPFLRRHAPASAPSSAECAFGIEASDRLFEQIETVSRQEAATVYMTFLATFAVLLHRLTGDENLVIGTYVSDRTRPETRRLMGVFVNMLPICLRLEGATTFRDVLQMTRDTVEQAVAHRELPMQDLQASLTAEGKVLPEIKAIFQFIPDSETTLQLPELEVERWKTPMQVMHWGLTINLVKLRALNLQAACDGNLYEPSEVKKLLQDYHELLQMIADDPCLDIRPQQSVSAKA